MIGMHKVTVCAECLTAACWHGQSMCDRSSTADIVQRSVDELRALDREHPDNWSAKRMAEIYGVGSDKHMDAVAAELETELEAEGF